MIRDRRLAIRDRRAALRVPAVFAVKGSVRGSLQLGQAEDVGPGGITLRRLQDLPLAVGAPLTLTFALPGETTELKATGVVVSDVAAGNFRRTGVRFVALQAEAERRIVRFCEGEGGAAELDLPRSAAGSSR